MCAHKFPKIPRFAPSLSSNYTTDPNPTAQISLPLNFLSLLSLSLIHIHSSTNSDFSFRFHSCKSTISASAIFQKEKMSTEKERETHVYLAKLAEQAERYDGMIKLYSYNVRM